MKPVHVLSLSDTSPKFMVGYRTFNKVMLIPAPHLTLSQFTVTISSTVATVM